MRLIAIDHLTALIYIYVYMSAYRFYMLLENNFDVDIV